VRAPTRSLGRRPSSAGTDESVASKGGNREAPEAEDDTESEGSYLIGVQAGVDAFAGMERYATSSAMKPKRVFRHGFNGFSAETDNMIGKELSAWKRALNADPDIRWYEENTRLHEQSEGAKNMHKGQWVPGSLRKVGGDVSSAQSGDGAGTIDVDIYIIDSGVDHPDVNVVERIDFTLDGTDLTPFKVLERYSLLERYALVERYLP
jgi:hypothetical protein